MSERFCNMCGGTVFEPGYNGRLSTTGLAPQCQQCGSAERHRIIRAIYDELAGLTRSMSVLHFAPDNTVDPSNFSAYERSVYGVENSMDLMSTGLLSGSYDMVLSNHVFEHVADDVAALNECLRVVGDDGIVHVNVPTPMLTVRTNDWGFPDEKRTFHFRNYGADIGVRFAKGVPAANSFAVFGHDRVTGVCDAVFFFSRRMDRLSAFTRQLQSKNYPCVFINIAAPLP